MCWCIYTHVHLFSYGKGKYSTVEENMGGEFFSGENKHLFTHFKDNFSLSWSREFSQLYL